MDAARSPSAPGVRRAPRRGVSRDVGGYDMNNEVGGKMGQAMMWKSAGFLANTMEAQALLAFDLTAPWLAETYPDHGGTLEVCASCRARVFVPKGGACECPRCGERRVWS